MPPFLRNAGDIVAGSSRTPPFPGNAGDLVAGSFRAALQ
jgi:hypothetical protein